MYRLQEASKTYRHQKSEVVALHPTSLEISRGEFVAIVGPSGSGKTTLLSVLGGMLAPSAGKVWLDGQDVYGLSPADRARVRRQKLGFVFQTFNLIPYLSVIENVQVPLMLTGATSDEQQKLLMNLLTRVGLECRLHHKPCELSVGQQQRVALARTLVNDPAVILADEPTGNLDPDTREHVLQFFEDLCEERRTVVMVIHDPAAAARATRILKLRDGAIVCDKAMLATKVA